MIDFLKKYELVGFSDTIPDSFLAQLDNNQHILLDNFNNFIHKKIYFADNFTELTNQDWKNIEEASKEKIKEWTDKVPIKPALYNNTIKNNQKKYKLRN